jgi:NADH-quinone oxidoreductase subunit M
MMVERRHTREIAGYGGVAAVMPRFAVIFAIAAFASAGLPLLNGFVGEFTILQGVFAVNRIWAAFAVFGIVLAAAYLLWLYQRTMLGDIRHEQNRHLPDLNARELCVLVPLVVWAVSIGIYPKPYFDLLDKPVAAVISRIEGARIHGAVVTPR